MLFPCARNPRIPFMVCMQDDQNRWYGELLHLCERVVAAMHGNECQVILCVECIAEKTGAFRRMSCT